MPMKLVRLTKMCLNETCNKVHIGRHFSDMFAIQNDLKHGDNLSVILKSCYVFSKQDSELKKEL
jgi:hypothetical protein